MFSRFDIESSSVTDRRTDRITAAYYRVLHATHRVVIGLIAYD